MGRRWPWVVAIVAVVAVAGAAVAVVATRASGADPDGPAPRPVVAAFLRHWQAGDYAAMYALLTPAARAAVSPVAFVAAYRHDAAAAGAIGIRPSGDLRRSGRRFTTTVTVGTRRFGQITEPLILPVTLVNRRYRIGWQPSMAFPGLLPGEQLAVRAQAPRGRGMIRGLGGLVLASGPASARIYPQGSPYALVTGYLAPPKTAAQRRLRVAEGWPPGRAYGQGGLEQSLDSLLAGRPSFELQARSPGHLDRGLAVRPGVPPHNVTTTLRPSLQLAATEALGGRYGGVVVLNTITGAVLADAGLGMDVIQPPGSTFKMVTASAALSSGKFTLESTFPYAHYILLDGWRLHNFRSEDCGGTLLLAFAVSCNSVFAPVADAVGAHGLIAMAGRYGFDHPPGLAYPAPESVMPSPASLDSDLMVGVAGIGQGGVEASPLQMATIAETIGNLGLRRAPHIIFLPRSASDAGPDRRVLTPGVAVDLRTMMEAVVNYGTGVNAAIPGVQVAGKTGTSQVGNGPSDAWFAAFAPAVHPRFAVAVLVIRGGVGGATAAPIARQVLEAALADG